MTDERDPNERTWVDEAEEALARAGEALKAAWEGTRDARMATLEAAKDAASNLGDAIDQGIAVVKEKWEPVGDDDTSEEEPTPDL
jgi:hypothetical protein